MSGVVAWMLEYVEDGEVEREFNGHDKFSCGRKGGQPLVLQSDLAAAIARAEALEKERDYLVTEYERAVGCGPQGYLHAALHLFNAITNAQVDQNAAAIVALQARAEAAEAALMQAHRDFGCELRDPNGTIWDYAAKLKERAEALERALVIAEAALADIGDADREPGDDVAWCERRAAQALPKVRAAIAAQQAEGSDG